MEYELTPLLKLSGIVKSFGGIIALDGVDLSTESGSLTCIIGPNGCGKTTLFNVITGAFPPTAGNIQYEGKDITGLPAYQIARKGIARKFRVPGIYPSLTVAENPGSRVRRENFCQSAAARRFRVSVPRRFLPICLRAY